MACDHTNKTLYGKEHYYTQEGVYMLRTLYTCPDCQELDADGQPVGQTVINVETEA